MEHNCLCICMCYVVINMTCMYCLCAYPARASQYGLQLELEALKDRLGARMHVISFEDEEVAAVLGQPIITLERVACREADKDLHRVLLALGHGVAADLGRCWTAAPQTGGLAVRTYKRV